MYPSHGCIQRGRGGSGGPSDTDPRRFREAHWLACLPKRLFSRTCQYKQAGKGAEEAETTAGERETGASPRTLRSRSQLLPRQYGRVKNGLRGSRVNAALGCFIRVETLGGSGPPFPWTPCRVTRRLMHGLRFSAAGRQVKTSQRDSQRGLGLFSRVKNDSGWWAK